MYRHEAWRLPIRLLDGDCVKLGDVREAVILSGQAISYWGSSFTEINLVRAEVYVVEFEGFHMARMSPGL